jgi:hypothetical protein
MNKDTTAAFPCSTGFDGGAFQTGMTLRDWFAGQVIAGMMANQDNDNGAAHNANYAYLMADAMLKERAK